MSMTNLLSTGSSSLLSQTKFSVCAEVCVKRNCQTNFSDVRDAAYAWLMSSFTITLGRHDVLKIPNTLLQSVCVEIVLQLEILDDGKQTDFHDLRLANNLLATMPPASSAMDPNPIVLAIYEIALKVCVFELNEDEEEEMTGLADDCSSGNQEQLPACQQWTLPNVVYHGLWESLYFDSSIKKNLLEYATTSMLFSERKVNSKCISCNRLILLHGPPGTGKTSLCKALAQKVSIRLSNEYETGQLLEVNTHSLFSKWFSESGKLVMKMFSKIKELLEESNSFICVLFDEVESLSTARKLAMSGNEPSDSIRVVNALLTQIDGLKNYPNVLVVATSNITEALDLAFLDRADLILNVPNPNEECRYEILRDCITELVRTKLVTPPVKIFPYNNVLNELNKRIKGPSCNELEVDKNHSCSSVFLEYECSTALLALVKECEGFSGRFLRKVPFQAFTRFCNRTFHGYRFVYNRNDESKNEPSVIEFLKAIESVIKKEASVRLK